MTLVHKSNQPPAADGAFSYFGNSLSWDTRGADWYTTNLKLNANSYNLIYSDDVTTVQLPSVKVRVKTGFK